MPKELKDLVVGLDIGTTRQTMMQWLVLTPLKNIYAPGALAGDYVGASAEVTAAVGGGANLLVGGFSQAFTLQPLSLQTQTGLNLAIGVSQFQMRSTDELIAGSIGRSWARHPERSPKKPLELNLG